MYWIAFGNGSSAAGASFYQTRHYVYGRWCYLFASWLPVLPGWTPLVTIKWRYGWFTRNKPRG